MPALGTSALGGLIGGPLSNAQTWNGIPVPVLAFHPDWSDPFRVRIDYATQIQESIQPGTELRLATRPRPLCELKFSIVAPGADASHTLRRALDLCGETPFAVPLWSEVVSIDAAEGATIFSTELGESLWQAHFPRVLLWRDHRNWEIMEVETFTLDAQSVVNFKPMSMTWSAGDMAVPLLFGNLNLTEAQEYLTDELARFKVEFAERFLFGHEVNIET